MVNLLYAFITSFVLANITAGLEGVKCIALMTTDPSSGNLPSSQLEPAGTPTPIYDTLTTFTPASAISIDSGDATLPTSESGSASEDKYVSVANQKFALGSTAIADLPTETKLNNESTSVGQSPTAAASGPAPARSSISKAKLFGLVGFMIFALTFIGYAQRKSCRCRIPTMASNSTANLRENPSGRSTAIGMNVIGGDLRRRTTNENLDASSTDTLPLYTPTATLARVFGAGSRVLSSIISPASEINRAIPDPEIAPPTYHHASPPAYSPSPLSRVQSADEVAAEDETLEDYASDSSESDIGDTTLDALSSTYDHTEENAVQVGPS